ncbi:MAG: DUF2917 domain-containing protein [Desulfuromonadales bacterium]|nr:DUF2917 domain-containing protein [Desulfuromonadales bacterium]
MEILLSQGELLDLGDNLKGLTIVCRSGCCWLTQTGDPRDFILRRQAQLEIQSRGQVVVMATSSCRLQLTPAKSSQFYSALLATLKASGERHLLPAPRLESGTGSCPVPAATTVGKNR